MSERATSNEQPATVQVIADQILAELQKRVGDAWNDRFTAEHRALAAEIARDAAGLAILAMSRPQDRDVIAKEREHIYAQLKNVTSYEESRLQAAFWAAAADVVNRATMALLIGSGL